MRTHSADSDPTLDAALLAAAQRSRTSPSVVLDELPDVLLLDEVARVLRCSRWTIRHALHSGTFHPLPIAKRPFRWLKADLVAELAQLKNAADLRARDRERRDARTLERRKQPRTKKARRRA